MSGKETYFVGAVGLLINLSFGLSVCLSVPEINESLEKVLVSTIIAESRKVSVLKKPKFQSRKSLKIPKF